MQVPHWQRWFLLVGSTISLAILRLNHSILSNVLCVYFHLSFDAIAPPPLVFPGKHVFRMKILQSLPNPWGWRRKKIQRLGMMKPWTNGSWEGGSWDFAKKLGAFPIWGYTPGSTNIGPLENGPGLIEDVFLLVKMIDFPASRVSLLEGRHFSNLYTTSNFSWQVLVWEGNLLKYFWLDGVAEVVKNMIKSLAGCSYIGDLVWDPPFPDEY